MQPKRIHCSTFAVIIFAVAIQLCLGQVPVNTTKLSSPRKAMSSVAIGDRVLFVGGYDFHDSAPSARIDVFNAINQTWGTPLSLPTARGYVSPVVVDSKIYFLGGITRTNTPFLYQPSTHSFVPLGYGPTVRTPKQLSVVGSSLTVVGSFSADFLDLNTGNWTYNSNLTKLMTSRKDSMIFAYQRRVFIIGGVDVDQGNVDLTETTTEAWIFDSQTDELKHYTNISSYIVMYDPLAKFPTYAGSENVLVVRLPDRCLMYHLVRDLWHEQKDIFNATHSVTVSDITYLFGNNFAQYDWNEFFFQDSQDLNIRFGYAVQGQVFYIIDGVIVFLSGPDRVQKEGLAISGPVRFGSEWNAKYIFADDAKVYVVDTEAFDIMDLTGLSKIISLFVSADGNLQIFDGTSNNRTWRTYTPASFPSPLTTTPLDFTIDPLALVDGDFVSVYQGTAFSITDATTLHLFSPFLDGFVMAQDGNTLVAMFTAMPVSSTVLYKQMDIYDTVNGTWTTVDMPEDLFLGTKNEPLVETFLTAAAVNRSIMVWAPGAFAVHDTQLGNWTKYDATLIIDGRTPVRRSVGLDGIHFQVPIINDIAYIHSDGLNFFFKFAPDLLNFTATAPIPNAGLVIEQPVANKEKLYISIRNGGNISAIYIYDTVSAGWQTTLLPFQMPYAVIAASEDYLVVVGSDNRLQILSIELNQWNDQVLDYDSIPGAVIHVGNITLVAGGVLPSGRYSDTVLIISDDVVFREQPSAVPVDPVIPPTASPVPVAGGLTDGELAAAIVIPSAAVLGAVLAVLLVLLKKRKKSKRSSSTIGLEAKFGEWFTPFNDIQFGQQLGQGANGQVFQGKWKSTDVALKVSVTQANQSVIAELSLMINLRPHPNVVQLFGYSVHPETNSVILILEFCNGGALNDYLTNQSTALSTAQKVQLMQGIARGIVHLHSNNIVHRDLAARNVLLHQGEPKITDFGMSRVVDEQQQRGTTKSELGPIRWMAPESLKNKQYSTKSDVWSFGIVMYEVMAQQEPHTTADPITIGRQIRDEGVTPHIGALSECPAAVSSLMKQCWEMAPEKRPSMEAVLQTLEQIN